MSTHSRLSVCRCPALLVGLAALGALVVGTAAQIPMHVFAGGTTPDDYGTVVSGAGDVNADGFADVLIGRPETVSGGPGTVFVMSGRDGSLLFQLAGQAPGDRFGQSLSALDDVDRDGHADFLVGASRGNSVDVFSGATGTPIHHIQVPTTQATIGNRLAALGDIDGDGVRDFIIGVGLVAENTGAVAVLSGATAQLLMLEKGKGPGDMFGSPADAGDVDGDGHPDFMVMHNDNDLYFSGRVSIFSGKNGSLLVDLGGGSGDQFGTSMSALGDIDGDGGDEVLIGAPQFGNPHSIGNGYVVVYSWKQHAILMQIGGDLWGGSFGQRSRALGDVNLDGVPDFYVATGDYALGFGAGAVHVYSGLDASLILVLHGNYLNDLLAQSTAAAGDVNGDGRCDLIVGVNNDSVFATTGHDGYAAVFVMSPPFEWLGAGLAGTVPAPILFGNGTLQPDASTTIGLNGAQPDSVADLVLGLSAVNAPFKGGTLVPDAAVIVPSLMIGAAGNTTLRFAWPAGMPAGTSLYLQAWFADPAGPKGFAASNALKAVTP